jgi:hypothetical protein
MRDSVCTREDELLGALGRGWVGEELAAHTAGCARCAELRAVAGALLADRADAIREAPVPSAGTMWWRMRVRLWQESEARARRLLLVGQGVTLAIAFALAGSLFGDHLADGVVQLIGAVRMSTPLLLAVATSLILAPVAGWAVIRQK